jgi:hypothetical protein
MKIINLSALLFVLLLPNYMLCTTTGISEQNPHLQRSERAIQDMRRLADEVFGNQSQDLTDEYITTDTNDISQPADIDVALRRAFENAFRDVDRGSRIAVVHMSAPNEAVNDFLLGELQHILFDRRFIVVDRSELDRIRNEQAFQLNIEVDEQTAVRIGKFVGADVVVTGTIDGIGQLRRLRLKVLNVQTGVILGTASEPFSTTLDLTPSTNVTAVFEYQSITETSIQPQVQIQETQVIVQQATITTNENDIDSNDVRDVIDTFNVRNVNEWSNAVNSIRNGGNNRAYTINVIGEISVPVGTGNTFGSVIGLRVTLQGGGILSKSANGRLIGIGGNQTVIAENITLDGHARSSAVVEVEGGVFRMVNGAIVKDNACTGVWVNGGTFDMLAGSITNNTASQSHTGGGVTLVNSSTLIMQSGATISHNNSNSHWGPGAGAVYIGRGSTFTMEGGYITGNTSNSRGNQAGGVFTNGSFIINNGEVSHNRNIGSGIGGGGLSIESGTATMNGGRIQQNSTTGAGGGVSIFSNATFNLNNGIISNNRAGSTGGGINTARTFNMNGGMITDNQAVTNGGGVHSTSGAAFTKTGGNITNNVAGDSGNTAFQVANPNRWRNANARLNENTSEYGFWLNE